VGAQPFRQVVAGPVSAPALAMPDIDVAAAMARPTGVPELDRVLGGGVVPGGVVLLAGEPGVGKSTLLLDVAARCASAAAPSLIITGEESAAQVRLRAERIGAASKHLYLAAETDLAAALTHIEAVSPALLVIDSVQTMVAPGIDGGAGGVTQVRACAAAITRIAKQRAIATVLVGHVTKDGSVAGPRLLEHLVDVVLSFEGERHSRLRMVRAMKNRFGSADEVGCFDLHDTGIDGIADPSGLFLADRAEPVAGTCVTVSLEGRRPIVAELQALVTESTLASPRRASSGLDSARIAMVLAVLDKRGGVPVGRNDVYVATVGGVRLTEPASDLATALAVASAYVERPLADGVVAIGEVGLTGEIRRVTGVRRRLEEAQRLGFTRALVPPGSGPYPSGIEVVEVPDVHSALRRLTQVATPPPRPVETPTPLDRTGIPRIHG